MLGIIIPTDELIFFDWEDHDDPSLVGGLEHEWIIFPYIGNFIIPSDELIFFRGVGRYTTNQ
jgi:hypothetical protein